MTTPTSPAMLAAAALVEFARSVPPADRAWVMPARMRAACRRWSVTMAEIEAALVAMHGDISAQVA
jgi:hypothetical protein